MGESATEQPVTLQGKGQAARSAAEKRLQALHAEEFEQIHAEERKARGLFPKTKRDQKTRAELQEEVDKLQEELTAIRAQYGV